MNKNKVLLSILFAGAVGLSSTVSANTMLGSYIKYDGWSTWHIDQFNQTAHKPMAVQTLFTNFKAHWGNLSVQSSNIVSRGGTPMISLMPSRLDGSDILGAIVAGDEDAYLNSWINSFMAWRNSYPEGERPVILLRFGHEFNGNWYSWGNRPEAFKAAWRHIHGMFEAAGANEGVEWVWCANATDVDDYNDMRVYYPGDDVVDWTSLDGYNFGTNYSWSSWRSFDQVFSYAYNRLVENYPDKPIILGEVASAEPGDTPDPAWGQYGNDSDAYQDKNIWVADMMMRIEEAYPAIRAIAWFNINKEVSWALAGTAKTGYPNTGLAGYNLGIESDHFTSAFTRFGLELPQQQANLQQSPIIQQPPQRFYVRLLNMLVDAAHAKKIKAPKKEKRKVNKLSKKALKAKLKELQRALAKSRKPKVIGKERRKKEAEGRRKMSKKFLKKIYESRMQLGN